MIKIVNSNGAKKLDEDAQRLGISGMILMERAALSTAEFIKDRLLTADKDKKVIAICGSGNNGGDGIACGRILYEWGFNVEIFVIGKEEKFTGQTRAQVDLAVNSEVDLKIVEPSELITDRDDFKNVIVIDAIFGVGFKGRLEGDLEKLARYLNMFNSVKVAVDIPSGVNGSNGRVESTAIKCDYTITFGVSKTGIAVYPGKDYAGEVIVADIGFPKKALESVSYNNFTFDETDIGYFLPK